MITIRTWLQIIVISAIYFLFTFVFFDLSDLTRFSIAFWLLLLMTFGFQFESSNIQSFFIPRKDNELAFLWSMSLLGVWVNLVPLALTEIPVSSYAALILIPSVIAAISMLIDIEKQFEQTMTGDSTAIFLMTRLTVFCSYIFLFGWVIRTGEWEWQIIGVFDLLMIFHTNYVAY